MSDNKGVVINCCESDGPMIDNSSPRQFTYNNLTDNIVISHGYDFDFWDFMMFLCVACSGCGLGCGGVVLGIEVWFSILRNRGVNGRSCVLICVVEAIA